MHMGLLSALYAYDTRFLFSLWSLKLIDRVFSYPLRVSVHERLTFIRSCFIVEFADAIVDDGRYKEPSIG